MCQCSDIGDKLDNVEADEICGVGELLCSHNEDESLKFGHI